MSTFPEYHFLMGHAGYFTYLGTPITEDGECTTEFSSRLNRGQAIGESPQKMWKSHSIPISTKIRLMKALVWPVPSVEESVRMTEDIDKWRKCVHGVANPGIEDG